MQEATPRVPVPAPAVKADRQKVIHRVIRETFAKFNEGPETDNALGLCKDPECSECARIICPYDEPLHFHHDGCPACAHYEAEKEAREAK